MIDDHKHVAFGPYRAHTSRAARLWGSRCNGSISADLRRICPFSLKVESSWRPRLAKRNSDTEINHTDYGTR